MRGKFKSSWENWKIPEWMNDVMINGYTWIEYRKNDDGAEGLWRIHDKLYDLTTWVDKHPGGKFWIHQTKGIDITESFESHHLNPEIPKMLKQFYVRDAISLRNSPYTFEPDGCFATLKRRVWEEIKDKPKGPSLRTKLLLDFLFIASASTALLATVYYSYKLALISAVLLTLITIGSHNLSHQRDSWRMHYFSMVFGSTSEWRINHVLSHHSYTNTRFDMEIILFEPFLKWLPKEDKSYITRYLSWIYQPIIFANMFFVQLILRIILHGFTREEALCFMYPVVIYLFSGVQFYQFFKIFIFIQYISGMLFGLIGKSTGHHHPDIFHEGDKPRKERDWALNQMDATHLKVDFSNNFPVPLLTFGHHTLHHIFPAIDCDLLAELYPIFIKTCKDFDFNLQTKTVWELYKGQCLQMSRIITLTKEPIKISGKSL